MSIRRKFLAAISIVIAVFALVIAGVTVFTTASSVDEQVAKQKQQVADRLLNILTVTDSLIQERVKSSMTLLKQRGLEVGMPSQGDNVMVKTTSARQLYLGNQPQANDFTLVDNLTAVMGGTATLFSKTGEDYIRVSTNVIKDGQRAIGTKLAPQGKAMANIVKGTAYYGAVDILGSPYLTGYEPMKNAAGQVIGIWYVGYSADLKVLEQAISQSRLLEEGFVALRDGKGNIRMHSSHINDADVERALQDKDAWSSVVVPFEKWGYDLVLVASESEKSGMVSAAVFTVLIKIILASAAVLATIFVLINHIVGKPLDEFITVVNDLASGEGNLTFRFNAARSDEFGQMSRGFNKLLEQLQHTLQSVSSATDAMLSQSQQLNDTAQRSSNSVSALSNESKAIDSAITQLQQNAAAVCENIERASEAASAADADTRTSVSVLSATIKDIEAQAQDVDASVQVINELAKASEEISGVMDVIRNIAEQTNLLALNAAIEAVRAGEQGRGFAVVADEVRSLASRTQTSTEEIRIMIERLQQGSREASQKMQNNKENAYATVEVTQNAGTSLEKSLGAVATITTLNQETSGMASHQNEIAREVNKRLGGIQSVGQENLTYAATVSENCARLVEQIQQMQKSVEALPFLIC
ncbi:MAG: methyl-accepting chemotaxis protein [Aestuariibacter sp.]|nr:methyl-accepting chemotaxis protein [Aestuariibacter sp.]MCP4232118.1 methyl-accepting chemotaxis protein [Aestuariibacter sp.]MCP4525834.1 methyl-accepting chemotaxis protein [Aestuariibacter sp.]MCP4948711.1 methyl-accepting chemotaxis protein [Aestuariibacter sp.]